jgi:hypothetical protein
LFCLGSFFDNYRSSEDFWAIFHNVKSYVLILTEIELGYFLGDFFTNSSGYPGFNQGCQMVYFQTKNPNLGKLWRVLQWKMLLYFMSIWYILLQIGIFYGDLI